uniref:coronin-2B isoform X2 n=1 Tax=Myxine glutinosa TaxID=7769 RepID=UPI00358F4AA2
MTRTKMPWRPPYRCSKFRHVYGRTISRGTYEAIPISSGVGGVHGCDVNPRFIAVVTEAGGGGAFIILPLSHHGRIDPLCPRVCGHRRSVLDVKWNPFNDYVIASCSEDATVCVWEIPEGGLRCNLTKPLCTLVGHIRRVSLIQWHPTASGLLFTAGYDNKVLLWCVEESSIPVRLIACHTDVVLSLSFNVDGSLLATSCRDRRLRVVDSRTGTVLQEKCCTNHRVNLVAFLGNLKRLVTTGVSQWNSRQLLLWDQEDLSEPLVKEEVDGLSGLLFPFYDADTRMLYVAGKGDGNIRYYELNNEKPFLVFLGEFRSPLPQKGLGTMPKRGLDVGACEVYRFYRVVITKSLIEPISMIVPRKSDVFQEDLYPKTASSEPALTAEQWLSGVNRSDYSYPSTRVLNTGHCIDPNMKTMMRLKHRDHSLACWTVYLGSGVFSLDYGSSQLQPVVLCPLLVSLMENYKPTVPMELRPRKGQKAIDVERPDEKSPPANEKELRRMVTCQRDEIRQLREQLAHRDLQLQQCELELQNQRNTHKPVSSPGRNDSTYA